MAPPLRPAAAWSSGCPELLPVQVPEHPHHLLHLLPRRDAGADLGLERLRNIKGLGPAVRAPEAQREMRPVLGAVRTVAPGPTAAAVGLGQRAEHDAGGQPRKIGPDARCFTPGSS